ncbi:MAG: hypothetical protein Q8936_10570 [Bacillota bacterium]|nr:hypothetical protein [Bacillota bacterium]
MDNKKINDLLIKYVNFNNENINPNWQQVKTFLEDFLDNGYDIIVNKFGDIDEIDEDIEEIKKQQTEDILKYNLSIYELQALKDSPLQGTRKKLLAVLYININIFANGTDSVRISPIWENVWSYQLNIEGLSDSTFIKVGDYMLLENSPKLLYTEDQLAEILRGINN